VIAKGALLAGKFRARLERTISAKPELTLRDTS